MGVDGMLVCLVPLLLLLHGIDGIISSSADLLRLSVILALGGYGTSVPLFLHLIL